MFLGGPFSGPCSSALVVTLVQWPGFSTVLLLAQTTLKTPSSSAAQAGWKTAIPFRNTFNFEICFLFQRRTKQDLPKCFHKAAGGETMAYTMGTPVPALIWSDLG